MNQELRQLIGKNRLEEALRLLHNMPLSKKLSNERDMVESRLNNLNEQTRLGILSAENIQLESNKIRLSLLSICDAIEQIEIDKPKSKKRIYLLIGGIIILILAILAAYFTFLQQTCTDSKIAVLVANFQNTDKKSNTDAFSNSVVTALGSALRKDIFDVIEVGQQSRKMKRYDDYIRTQYFENTCDTSGLFVNGFLSVEEKVFNVYITIVNLQMTYKQIANEGNFQLSNPNGIEFSIRDDAKFLSDFVLSILKCYTGDSYEALSSLYELEKNDKQGIIKNNPNLRSAIAHYKGNCYALRGDNERAKVEYQKAIDSGNPELKTISARNMETADAINKSMSENEETRRIMAKNKTQHSRLLKEFGQVVEEVVRGLDKLLSR